jgi:hypothetical protein
MIEVRKLKKKKKEREREREREQWRYWIIKRERERCIILWESIAYAYNKFINLIKLLTL